MSLLVFIVAGLAVAFGLAVVAAAAFPGVDSAIIAAAAVVLTIAAANWLARARGWRPPFQ